MALALGHISKDEVCVREVACPFVYPLSKYHHARALCILHTECVSICICMYDVQAKCDALFEGTLSSRSGIVMCTDVTWCDRCSCVISEPRDSHDACGRLTVTSTCLGLGLIHLVIIRSS